MILVDTNLLGRITDSTDPHCAAARRAVHVLFAKNEQLIIVPQNLYEFWSIATRRKGRPPVGQNGLGMTCNLASQWMQYFRRRFSLLVDRADLLDHWHALVRSHNVQGLKSHDARLVAAMQTHGITRLLTFNVADFKQFSITIIDPATV
jgi:predicted nucleic acid-binding protein